MGRRPRDPVDDVSHDSVAALAAMFAPPGLRTDWLADLANVDTAASYDVVVCTTAWAAAEFRRLDAGNLVQVPLGVDLARFHPRHADGQLQARLAGPGQPLLMHCSRLSRRSGRNAPLAPPGQVEFSNLAISGALVRDVAAEQLPQAMSLAPAAASLLVGMNDTLRGTFDLAGIAVGLEQIVCGLQQAGSLVLTASLPDPGLLLRIPGSLRRPLARRAHAINAVLSELARHYEVVHIDLTAHPAVFSADPDVSLRPLAFSPGNLPAPAPAARPRHAA